MYGMAGCVSLFEFNEKNFPITNLGGNEDLKGN
jgi:hypothetical protein